MTDAEIEAGLTDTLPDEVAREITEVYGPSRAVANLCLTVREVSREIITRLRAAGISDTTIANALVHEPARAREYYTLLAALHRELDDVAGDVLAVREVKLRIQMLKYTYNGRYGR